MMTWELVLGGGALFMAVLSAFMLGWITGYDSGLHYSYWHANVNTRRLREALACLRSWVARAGASNGQLQMLDDLLVETTPTVAEVPGHERVRPIETEDGGHEGARKKGGRDRD